MRSPSQAIQSKARHLKEMMLKCDDPAQAERSIGLSNGNLRGRIFVAIGFQSPKLGQTSFMDKAWPLPNNDREPLPYKLVYISDALQSWPPMHPFPERLQHTIKIRSGGAQVMATHAGRPASVFILTWTWAAQWPLCNLMSLDTSFCVGHFLEFVQSCTKLYKSTAFRSP